MINRSRVCGAALALLMLSFVLSSCGAAPVAQYWPGLTVADGVVYAISGLPQQVYMLDAETGVTQRTFTPQGQYRGVVYWSPVTVGGEMAFVGFGAPQSKFYGLFAFDPTTGTELWHVEVDNLILDAPVYADGIVYFGTESGQVYAVDTVTHNVKPGWSFQAKEAIWGSPLVAGDRLYVPAMDHHLYCLDAQTGQVIWDFEAGGALAAQPSPDDGTLYQGALDGRVYAIQADSGQKASSFDFQADNWIWSEALVADGRLYVTSLDGNLYGLDAATGQALPGYPYKVAATDYIRAAPAQVGGLIIIATANGQVVAVNGESGQVQGTWTSGTLGVGILTTPVISGERIYVILANGQVQTFELVKGLLAPSWTFSPPAAK